MNPRRALSAIGVVAAVAAAAVVWQNLPTQTDVLGPFDVHGEAGTPTTGRALEANVTGVRITPVVNGIKPAGVWVVVDTELAGTTVSEYTHSKLVVGPNTYTPSDRFTLDSFIGTVNPGITERGSWVFDVAPDLVTPGAAEPLTLLVWAGDGRLDSRLVIRIPTEGSRLSRVDEVALDKPRSAAS
ncbi:MAG TPA: hypothetical protein VJR50_08675 [Mycobacterium sp.]|nr:hypothetical protein [Mycobacterium sp.]